MSATTCCATSLSALAGLSPNYKELLSQSYGSILAGLIHHNRQTVHASSSDMSVRDTEDFPLSQSRIPRLSLSLLDLSNNDVAMLPPELGRMTTLRALPLMGNPIRGYSSAVINGPISILLAKLRHRLEDEVRY